MPRRPGHRNESPEPPDHADGDEVIWERDPDDQPNPMTRLEEVLDRIGGDAGRHFASVYRLDDYGDKTFLRGRVSIGANDDPLVLLERLADMHGGGHYLLQLRAEGKRGTTGNVTVRIAGEPKGQTAPPAAAAVAVKPDTDLRDLLMRQNDKLMELLVGRGPGAPASPAAPTTIDGTLDQLKKLFGVARSLSREQSAPAIPTWLNTLGEVAAPFLVTLAAGLGAAGAKLQQRRLPASSSPPPPAAGAAQAAPADEAPAANDAESAQTMACRALITAELAQPAPDPIRLARAMWSVAAADIGPLLSVAPPGVLADNLVETNPELTGREEVARAVEAELRRLSAPAPTPTPTP